MTDEQIGMLTKKEALEELRNNLKLNEELTAENARLLSVKDDLLNSMGKLEKIIEEDDKFLSELNSIKKKWWYKLMTWVW